MYPNNSSLSKFVLFHKKGIKVFVEDLGEGTLYQLLSRILVILSVLFTISLTLLVGYFGLLFFIVSYYIYSIFNDLNEKTELKHSKYLESIVFENSPPEFNLKIKIYSQSIDNDFNKEIELNIAQRSQSNDIYDFLIFEKNNVVLNDSSIYKIEVLDREILFQFLVFHPELSGFELSDRVKLVIDLQSSQGV